MSGYIHHIIRYFFHHDASDEMTARVQERLGRLGDEADETIRQIWDECGEATVNDASTEKAYRQMMTSLQGSQSSAKRFSWLKMAAMWAIPVILLGAAVWFYSVATERAKLYSEVVFMHKFTAYGERSMIILPDSSKVWLNGGSSLIYPSSFVSAERNVCLTGEDFFEVKKDNGRPLTVETR